MSIDIEQLRSFQTRELEQPNMQTNGRQPVFTKTIEWSLVEIVILLTQIRDVVNPAASKASALAATPAPPPPLPPDF